MKSGRLRRSIRIRRATFRRITIAAEAPYAAAHNFGVDETVTVRAHTRRTYGRVQEKYTTSSGKERTRTKRVETGSHTVRSHTRHMQLPLREELTRWRNPNEELPENNSCVLMKVSDGEHERIYLGARQDDVWMCDGGYSFCQNAEECLGYDGVVIGWRPIYENE